jgi:hypothetical protein
MRRWKLWCACAGGCGLSIVAVLVALRHVLAGDLFFSPATYSDVVFWQYVWLTAIAGVVLVGLCLIGQRPSRPGWHDVLLPALAVPLIAWWILDRGMVHIGGYDHSLLANCGWLQVQGMRPHVDFPCTLCPHFYLAAKYGFLWFGVAWRSAVILAAVYAAVSFTWSYFLLRSLELPAVTAGLIALLAQSLSLMLGCYFWYNSVAAADATVLVLSALAWVDRPRSRLLFASVTVALALVLLDKPNGWVLPVCIAVGFAGSREHRLPFLGCVLGSLGIVAAVAQLGPFDVAATLRVYLRLSKTRVPNMEDVRYSLMFDPLRGKFDVSLLVFFVSTFSTVLAVGLLSHRAAWRTTNRRWWATLWVYAGALAFGVASFFTNSDLGCMDLAVPTVAFAVWLAKCDARGTTTSVTGPRHLALAFAVALCLFGLLREVLFDLLRGAAFLPRFRNADLTDLAVPALALALWFAMRRPRWASARQAKWALAGALVLAGVLLWKDYRPNWTAPGVLALAFAASLEGVEPEKLIRFNVRLRGVAVLLGAWLCLFCLCQGLFNGWTRYRVLRICGGYFWQPQVVDEEPRTPFLAGVRCGPKLVQLMKELNEVVSEHPEESVFFGPWIEFGYPAFGRNPPAGFPVWWHGGTSYFPEDAEFVTEAIRNRKIGVLIFVRDIFHRMPESMVAEINKQYTADKSYPSLTVYLAKK